MVIIIGAGLSGLLIAYRLQEEGIPFKILEARDSVGGRIKTVYGSSNTPVEMGATWFNSQHVSLISLLKELDISFFEQLIDDRVFFEASSASRIQLVQIPPQSPSFRVAGGTSRIINYLLDRLESKNVLLNQSVSSIKIGASSVLVTAKNSFPCSCVVLALPPKLWAQRILFEPGLDMNLLQVANETHTWMEDAIKVSLTYKTPFWQDENQSSTFFSQVGPITELYDHSNRSGSKFALCGFVHSSFGKLTGAERRTRVLSQLQKIFGVRALEFVDYEECIWRNEEHTFEQADKSLVPHQNNGNPIFNKSLFEGRLWISGSETASKFPGYLEGAVQSGNAIAEKITSFQQSL